MKSQIIKLISIILIFTIILGIYLPVISYATNEIEPSKKLKDNVEFNVTINSQKETNLDTKQQAVLNIELSVNDGSYLSNIIIKPETNSFKIIEDINEENKNNIKSIKDNEIRLEDIEGNNKVTLQLSIKFPEDNITKETFKDEIKMILDATYTNKNGEETEIEKVEKFKLNWSTETQNDLNVELTKNIKHNENTILGIKITNGVKDNKIPLANKNIEIQIPKLNNKVPEKIIALEKGSNYKYENEVMTINKNYDDINWETYDTYNIILIYNTVASQDNISLSTKSKITTVTNQELENNSANMQFNINSTIGGISEISIINLENINKGYMFANLNRKGEKIETSFLQTYKINVGYAEIIDKIAVIEKSNSFLNQEDQIIKDAYNNIVNKKIEINKNEFKNILGEDGEVIVKNIEGVELGKLNNQNLSIEINEKNIKIETSKPQNEGTLNIKIEKAINGNIDYTKDELNEFEKLSTTIEQNVYKGDTIFFSSEYKNETKLDNPTSKANLLLNNDTLSTVIDNNEIVLNVELKNNKIDTALWENPRIIIDLPRELTEIKVNSIDKLYDNELTQNIAELNDHQIVLGYSGKQTQYNSGGISEGTVLRIAMNLKLDMYTPSNNTKIIVKCINDATKDEVIVESPIKIVAPEGMILTNQIEIDGKKQTAIKDKVEDIKINTNSNERKMTISGKIINNIGKDTDGVNVIGRIPFQGNKSIDEVNLNSTFNTTISSEIQVDNMENIEILYSENGEEPLEGAGWSNNWTERTKSFKIVKNGVFSNRNSLSFRYNVLLPKNIDYNNMAKTSYGVYYNNESIDGINRNLATATPVGITTGPAPEIKANIKVNDTNEGFEIANEGQVKEGEYITYSVELENTGSEDATDVKINTILPSGISFVKYNNSTDSEPIASYRTEYLDKEEENIIEKLKAGEKKTIQIHAKVTQMIDLLSDSSMTKLETIFKINASIINEEITRNFVVNNTEGFLNLKLTSSITTNFSEGRTFAYLIDLQNSNLKEKTNVKVELQLAEGTEFVGVVGNYQNEYDKNTNILTIYIGKITNIPQKIIINAKTISNANESSNSIATVSCNETNETSKSNLLRFASENLNKIIQTNQTTNITGDIFDTENVTFYIEIKNTSNETQKLVFKDYLDPKLDIIGCKISINAEKVRELNTQYIIEPFELPAKGTAMITIEASIFTKEQGESFTIENKPTLQIAEMYIPINSISIDVKGTGEIYTVNNNENQDKKQQREEDIINNKLNIGGKIWTDQNKNGQFDQGEEIIPKIEVILFDSNNNTEAKNTDGSVITTTTNEDGEYSFSELQPGKYNIIAIFDNDKYVIGKYNAINVDEHKKSKFVNAKYKDNNVAATDIVELVDKSIYNINLGLEIKDKFSLKLQQVVKKVSITNSEGNIRTIETDKENIELEKEEIQKGTMLIEYEISIFNEGNVPGYAQTIVDYIPRGTKFISEQNKDWYMKKDGNLYTSKFLNDKIEPGDSRTVKLVLIKSLEGTETASIKNLAEIYTSYNEKGIQPVNALAGNRVKNENDMNATKIIVLPKTTSKIVIICMILAFGMITIIAIVYVMKKNNENEQNSMAKIDNLEE